jgi:hypothetical protein
MRRDLLAAFLVLVASATATSGDAEVLAIGAEVPADVSVVPLAAGGLGEPAKMASLAGDPAKPLAVAFWSSRCPVCRRYVAAMKTLARDFEGRARFALVLPDSGEPEADLRGVAEAVGPAFFAAVDRRRDAANRLGVHVTPTVLVVDAAGTLRYRGPIDDDRRNRRRDTTEHLRAALDAVVAGREVEAGEHRAFGSSVRRRRE